MLTYCSLIHALLSVSYTFICFLLTIIAAYVIYTLVKTCKQAIESNTRSSNHLFGIAFVICTLLAIFTSFIELCGPCYGIPSYHIHTTGSFWFLFMAFQSIILLLISFNKMLRFELRFVTKTLCIAFILSFAMLIFTTYALRNHLNYESWKPLLVLSLFAYITCVICLISIYLFQLIDVYKDCTIDKSFADHQLLVTSVAQTAVLGVSTVVLILAEITVIVMFDMIDICIAGIYMNFIFIIMQYKSFKIYYLSTCSHVHSLCFSYWINALDGQYHHNTHSEFIKDIDTDMDRLDMIMTEGCSDTDESSLPPLKLHKKVSDHRPTDSIPLIVYNAILASQGEFEMMT